MIFITRKEHFSASHKLENAALSEKENKDIFGKCHGFHGHNYYLEVTLQGEIDHKSGYVMDLKKLKTIIHNEILDKVDHQFLNDVELFKNVIPTTENMAKIFFDILSKAINKDSVKVYSVKLFETEKNSVEYKA